MTVTFLSPSLSRNAGGIFEIERNLAQALQRTTPVRLTVLGLKDEYTEVDRPQWSPLSPLAIDTVGPRAFGYAPDLLDTLHATDADLVHLHALWMYTSVATLRWSRETGHPHVITINGMLDDWALNNARWKKCIAEWFYERANLETAACIQVNTNKERTALREFGISTPACVIPNGVTLPDSPSSQAPPWEGDIPTDHRVLLFLGRLHPKKGLRELITAWKQWYRDRSSRSNEWALAIIGWDDGGHEDDLHRQIRNAGLTDTVHVLGPRFGPEKEAAFTHADAFVLPSYSEGLPMAVLEAWSYALPALITPACNLQEGVDARAAVEVEPVSHSIRDGLDRMLSMTDRERKRMGRRGRSLVEESYSWPRVARQLYDVYRWVRNGGPRPDCVYTD